MSESERQYGIPPGRVRGLVPVQDSIVESSKSLVHNPLLGGIPRSGLCGGIGIGLAHAKTMTKLGVNRILVLQCSSYEYRIHYPINAGRLEITFAILIY